MCSFEAFVEIKEIEAPKVKLDRKPEPARAATEPPKKDVSTLLPDESIKDHLPVHSEPSSVEPDSQLKTTQSQAPEPVRKQVVTASPEVIAEQTRKQPPQEVFKAEPVSSAKTSEPPQKIKLKSKCHQRVSQPLKSVSQHLLTKRRVVHRKVFLSLHIKLLIMPCINGVAIITNSL